MSGLYGVVSANFLANWVRGLLLAPFWSAGLWFVLQICGGGEEFALALPSSLQSLAVSYSKKYFENYHHRIHIALAGGVFIFGLLRYLPAFSHFAFLIP